ncbi:hypothetical protein SISSUDRAFT_1015773 [Sistotremastrum suecicum HHB10207 ss-3]|uniref:Origin recognition complex subunit 5 n=1 Tax=Sistotremastrum suecicum HHB10207 ss-3 TaxID=1314776 RepID=A0A166H6Z1_9AGAM|nr:hypothetical protein SISSUDRAFT_1015773 [Sistotremastrum suecicum HHB10207 ss-3]
MAESSLQSLVADLITSHSAQSDAISHLATLLTLDPPPPFLYLHDYLSPNLTTKLVVDILDGLRSVQSTSFAVIDGYNCFTPRLFYDSVLNQLNNWTPTWEEGCSNFAGADDNNAASWLDSVDGFVQGIKSTQNPALSVKEKENSSHPDKSDAASNFFVFVYNTEKFVVNLPLLIAPFTRLREMTNLPATVIFLSAVSWNQIKPSGGAACEPYVLTLATPSQQETISYLLSLFPSSNSADIDPINPFNTTLKPLYAHFVNALYAICSTFIRQPEELAYIAAAQWPGFVAPVLADWRSKQLASEQNDADGVIFDLPDEETRLRLMKLFSPSWRTCMELVHPRLCSASGFSLSRDSSSSSSELSGLPPESLRTSGLSHMQKWIILASYIASHNAAKTDLRIFGKQSEGGVRKKGGGTRKTRSSAKIKASTHLMGPNSFPLDRLVAILGSFLADSHTNPMEDGDRSDPEVEAWRVNVFVSISELVECHLLQRVGAHDKLDGPPVFKCYASHQEVAELAEDLGVVLSDYLWNVV